MGSISTGTGLFSGLDFNALVGAMTTNRQIAIKRLELRAEGFKVKAKGLDILKSSLLTLNTSVQTFASRTSFEKYKVSNSDKEQLSVSASKNALETTHYFTAIQKSSTHELRSAGFANDQQTLGTGTISIARGGRLNPKTLLDSFNGGNGVSRGTIQITDRSGASAEIDLTKVYTLDDVVQAINSDDSISVTATAEEGHLTLTDTSGSTDSDLIVADLNNGSTAADLGIANSVAVDILTGSEIYALTTDYALDQINDGNGIRVFDAAADMTITLSDDTELDIELNDATTINDVLNSINDHEDNQGKVLAEFSNGRIQLTDLSGGGGSSTFGVEDFTGASVVKQLGLDVAAVGGQITGNALLGGIDSVLLRNLRGGQGIDQMGEITITDRTGTSATLDLTNADSLDDVLTAINNAESALSEKLQLTARVNATGTGIEIIDTSGSTDSNLIIADVGGSTLAAQLGIEVDDATDSINSGSLNLRYVNEATLLSDYAPDGSSVDTGGIVITDSAGGVATIDITTASKTIGDVIQRINANDDISVTAELNETGDGFILIDEADGAGTLTVQELDGSTAADLRILGDGVAGGDGKQRISSRMTTVIDVEATDTLEDIVEKLNDAGNQALVTLIDDGSAFNSTHLLFSSKTSGAEGELIIDTSGFDLDLTTLNEAQDALLQVGDDPSTSFFVTSNTNQFDDIATGIDVTINEVSDTAATVEISKDIKSVKSALGNFVENYNSLIDNTKKLTKFDIENNQRGVLQGEGIILRVMGRLDSTISRTHFPADDSLRSLVDLGVRVTTDGKLTFDEEKFDSAYKDNKDTFSNFFLDTEDGLAKKLKDTIDSITDPFNGSITLQTNANQTSITSLENRIEELNELLDSRKSRLLLQFAKMEEALSTLSSQQQNLGAITSLSVGRR